MEEIKNRDTNVKPVDVKPIQQAVEKGIADIKLMVEMYQQKSATSNLRIFLESEISGSGNLYDRACYPNNGKIISGGTP